MSLDTRVRSLLHWPLLVPAILTLKSQLRLTRTIDEWVDFTNNFPETFLIPKRFRTLFAIAPAQIKSEIVALMQVVKELEPDRILEIGTKYGGTLFLFGRTALPNATMISVDLPEGDSGGGVPTWKIPLYEAFATGRQTVHLVRGNSHSASTLNRVVALLAGRPLDFLFIDGDHSYQGVLRDFQMYSPFVRKEGLVAFHDIVPDHKTRYGVETPSYAGEVYKFWEELKNKHSTLEIISNPNQDGSGIGIVRMDLD